MQHYPILFLKKTRHSPDVVCLQEVTPPFLSILAESSFIKKNYVTSDPGMIAAGEQPSCLEGHRSYDVLLLVKRGIKVIKWWEIPVPSVMDRRCIGVDIEWPPSMATGGGGGAVAAVNRAAALAANANGGSKPAATPRIIQVATIHLESTSSGAKYRAKQLDRLETELGKGKAPGTVLSTTPVLMH